MQALPVFCKVSIVRNVSAGCGDSSFATTIDFTVSPAVRKERAEQLITTQSALLHFVNDADYFKMPDSNFKFVSPLVRLVEDSARSDLFFSIEAWRRIMPTAKDLSHPKALDEMHC